MGSMLLLLYDSDASTQESIHLVREFKLYALQDRIRAGINVHLSDGEQGCHWIVEIYHFAFFFRGLISSDLRTQQSC